MTLNYDSTKCNPQFPKDDNDSLLREVLSIGSISYGIQTITKGNAEKVFNRIQRIEKVSGSWRQRDGQPVYVTLDEVKRWIGLSTNCSPLSDKQFNEKIEQLSAWVNRLANKQ